jgi:hypothetical protein
LTDSRLSAPAWRKRFAIRIEGAGRFFELSWFVWLPTIVAGGGLLVGLFLRDIGFIVVSLGIGFSAFLMWAFYSHRDD